MRDVRIISHFARYSGVSDGASGARPCEPSDTGADCVGLAGAPPPRWPAGGPPPRCPPPPLPCCTG